MSHVVDNQFPQLLEDLVRMFRTVDQRVAEGVRALERSDRQLAEALGASSDAVRQGLLAIEQSALTWAARHPDSDGRITVAVIQMVGDLQRIDRLATELASGSIAGPESRVELADRVRRMADLTLLQLGRTQEALGNWSEGPARQALAEDVELDAWYDILMSDVLDEVAERGEAVPELANLLQAARTLERIGDHAVGIASSLTRAVASPRP
jgi:phosphate transport system protein